MRLRNGVLMIVLVVAAGACRDVNIATDPGAFAWPDGSERQLTFNVLADRTPAWTPDGDSLVYSARGYPGVPAAPGVLIGIPAAGGTSRALYTHLHAANAGGPRYQMAPAVSHDGSRVAYVEIGTVAQKICPNHGVNPHLEPLVENVQLVVRDRDESSFAVTQTNVVLPGRNPLNHPQAFVHRSWPYHEQFNRHGRVAFSLDWSPDDARLVFSNGLQLFLWTPGASAATAVPNTAHAVHPAWSEDGELIAFVRQAPRDSVEISALCTLNGAPQPVTRVFYDNASPILTLIRPDGTVVRELGAGEDPAWGPDGALYARRFGSLVRIDAQTGTAETITDFGDDYDPAVSPDGSILAFTRGLGAESDLWLIDLTR